MKNPLISVIIPTYNRKHLLKKTLESVFSQTYKNLQIIVVDDGSTDNTENVISNFKDKWITYIKQDHRGAPSARNKGIENAKGSYIAFLDSDDKWLPTKIEKQIDIFEKSKLKLGVVYCGIEYMDENGKEIREKNTCL